MPNVFCPSSVRRALLSITALFAVVGVQAQTTAMNRQLEHLDLGVSGAGEFTNTVTGTNYLGATVTQQPSKTLGALVTIRYTKSPLIGFEFNYGYARYTQNISNTNPPNIITPGQTGIPQYINGGAQTNANEYTLGYVAHPPKLFGLHTFVAVGLGSTAFKGTVNGGQGLPEQARATYYYAAGIEQPLTPHFGLRGQFRQLFFLAPDFGQNYLTIKQRQVTSEPAAGFYLRF